MTSKDIPLFTRLKKNKVPFLFLFFPKGISFFLPDVQGKNIAYLVKSFPQMKYIFIIMVVMRVACKYKQLFPRICFREITFVIIEQKICVLHFNKKSAVPKVSNIHHPPHLLLHVPFFSDHNPLLA